MKTPYLKELEAESIYMIRESWASFKAPVFLYSIGKDSSVLLHLIKKAFYPMPIPFPLLHVDTKWKFKEMIEYRDSIAKEYGLKLFCYTNQEGVDKNINPFDYETSVYLDYAKTQALRQALDKYQFDAALGGARRDEEKSRAKERIFSIRKNHRWAPKKQRPEFWNNYNTELAPGNSMRVFPLSNWTELDVWKYIAEEKIPLVSLYFAKERPVVKRDGKIIIVDDERLKLRKGEKIERKIVRMRSLGCYPISAAIESNATNIEMIIDELNSSNFSERQGRLMDHESSNNFENMKKEGYF